ncbi:hypothetical protein [Oleomonas cavernae]|uniref:hypothetical protein n=1 Tax=Oleomonas cavernae TaxID=2320859 RepID=UPI001314F321|nr:hypothetical protein [Oleomonas cavernae]
MIHDKLKYYAPLVENVELRAILGDVLIFKSGSHEVILGYGFEKRPPSFEGAHSNF